MSKAAAYEQDRYREKRLAEMRRAKGGIAQLRNAIRRWRDPLFHTRRRSKDSLDGSAVAATVGVTVAGAVGVFVGSGSWTPFDAAVGLTLVLVLLAWGPDMQTQDGTARLALASSYGLAIAISVAYVNQVLLGRWGWLGSQTWLTGRDCDQESSGCLASQASGSLIYVWIIATLYTLIYRPWPSYNESARRG